MPNIGTTEILLLLLIALLLFGARRLPEVGRSLGRGMREFKDSITGKDDEEEEREEKPAELTASVTEEEDEPVSTGASRERDTV